MANELAVTYVASDGVEIELNPQTVATYMLIGEQQIDQREMASIIAKCRARMLNPLAGDCYITVFSGKASIIISRDYMNRAANSQPTFTGLKSGVITIAGDGRELYRSGEFYLKDREVLVGAWAEVYDSRYTIPMRCEICRDEYDQGRNLWKSKPATMLVKVAEMHALRKAYPGAFGGLYDASEMPDSTQSIQSQPQVIEQPQQPAQKPTDPRAKLLGELAQELAQVMDMPIADAKKSMFEQGDYRKMNEAQFSQYVTDIRNTIASARAIQDAEPAAEEIYEVA